jgi:hypothetical protein
MPGHGTLAEFWSIQRLEPTMVVAIYPDRERLHFSRASVN